MPEIQTLFPDLDSLDTASAYTRYKQLEATLARLPNGLPDPSSVTDDATLTEMCALLGLLRRRTAGPPRTSGTKRGPATQPSLEDL